MNTNVKTWLFFVYLVVITICFAGYKLTNLAPEEYEFKDPNTIKLTRSYTPLYIKQGFRKVGVASLKPGILYDSIKIVFKQTKKYNIGNYRYIPFSIPNWFSFYDSSISKKYEGAFVDSSSLYFEEKSLFLYLKELKKSGDN